MSSSHTTRIMQWVSFFCLLWPLTSALWKAPSATPADVVVHRPLKRLAFGSCVKQYKPQGKVWKAVANQQPDTWLWLGDAGYPRCSSVSCVEDSYKQLRDNSDYQTFLNTLTLVDGVWDDHDFGQNDGDRHYVHGNETQQLFQDFLGLPKDSPRRSRDGVYASLEFSNEVKVVMLDTRKHRDAPVVPSVGRFKFPLSSLIAAAVRFGCGLLGVGHSHKGDMLGETQWDWLETQLRHSEAKVHILVSSIQITTALPHVESWGHYPIARRRLFDLLEDTKPRGLVLLSGDVHFGQVLGSELGVFEVTASGMTHSVLDHTALGSVLTTVFLPFYCPLTFINWAAQQDEPPMSFFAGRNFGILDIDILNATQPGGGGATVTARILDLDGVARLEARASFGSSDNTSKRMESLKAMPPLLSNRIAFLSSFWFRFFASLWVIGYGLHRMKVFKFLNKVVIRPLCKMYRFVAYPIDKLLEILRIKQGMRYIAKSIYRRIDWWGVGIWVVGWFGFSVAAVKFECPLFRWISWGIAATRTFTWIASYFRWFDKFLIVKDGKEARREGGPWAATDKPPLAG